MNEIAEMKSEQRQHSAALWVLAFALAAVCSVKLYDAVWTVGACGIFLLLGATYGFCRTFMRRKQSMTIRMVSVFRGACFGVVAWIFSLASWYALQIIFGRLESKDLIAQIVLGALFGGVVGLAAAWTARHRTDERSERRCRWLLGLLGLFVLLLAVLYVARTGPREPARYPRAEQSPYRLPWLGGLTRLCCQSNRGIVSHRNREEFAYDFAMPVGSDVCAARAGTVIWVVAENTGNGYEAENNLIMIDHGDGTFGLYAHIRQNGSYVQVGQQVRQGERIAASGNVGHSLLPHLHFHVSDAQGMTLPVTFADVDTDGGIPRMFKRYTSGNYSSERSSG
jgi:Peptidase family M23